jgi:hypothetical protein
MDYPTLSVVAAILLYGRFEYRRRERKHQFEMEYLRWNFEPPPEAEEIVPRWRIVTVAITACIAICAAGVLIFKAITHPGYGTPLIVIGCIFLLLAVPLISMIVRDSHTLRGRPRRTE